MFVLVETNVNTQGARAEQVHNVRRLHTYVIQTCSESECLTPTMWFYDTWVVRATAFTHINYTQEIVELICSIISPFTTTHRILLKSKVTATNKNAYRLVHSV